MIVGVLKEIKTEENRVCMTPAGVEVMIHNGHSMLTIFSEPLILQRHFAANGPLVGWAEERSPTITLTGAPTAF